MSDLIRREDAEELAYKMVEELSESSIYWEELKLWAKELVSKLPSAELKVEVDEVDNEWLYLNTGQITLLETEFIALSTDGMYKEYIHTTDSIPTVAKWIDSPNVANIGLVDLQGNGMEVEIKMCSNCGYEGWETNYCPNCGARMD